MIDTLRVNVCLYFDAVFFFFFFIPSLRTSKAHRHVIIGLDKSGYQVNIFTYFSSKIYVVGTH